MPTNFSPLPSVERIIQLLECDLETGVMRWKSDLNPMVGRGKIAGSISRNGYRRIMIDGRSYFVHRILFKVANGRDPIEEVDHRLGVGLGNSIFNLRQATRFENNRNASLKKNNKCRLKGVCKNSRNSKNPWRALICVDKKQVHLGSFSTASEAHEAYCHAARDLHGQFARLS